MFKISAGKKIAETGLRVIDRLVVDKNKAIELKTGLATDIARRMLEGSGSSFTKITICVLVGIVVLVGVYTFLFQPERIDEYGKFALVVSPLIGGLTGAYAAGTTIQERFRNGGVHGRKHGEDPD